MSDQTNGDYSFVAAARQRALEVKNKVCHGFYLTNWVERKTNRKLLKAARQADKGTERNSTPLVSVLIPTYNRARILAERTVPSVLKQTYQGFEIVIVGDHCTDSTAELLARFGDKRIRFENLPQRGQYPANFYDRWMVAGTVPANRAIELSCGEWLAPLDDDDEFLEDHIEVLLSYALEHDYEMVYGKVQWERKPGRWIEFGSYPLRRREICRISALYHARLRFFKYDMGSWKYREPADWNMWRRMKEAGVTMGFVDKLVGRHYLEGTRRQAGDDIVMTATKGT